MRFGVMPLSKQSSKRGSVFVVSAPSGAGKRTVLDRVFDCDSDIQYSISATTRAPRGDEVHGRDYYFLDRNDFCRRIEGGEFVEWAEVHGNLYGTLRHELVRRIATGQDVILELDVQGMRNLKAAMPEIVSVFIMPPSLESLEERMRARGANTEEDMALRMRNARAEIAACSAFDYIVVNEELASAVADVLAIIRAERCRTSRHV